MGSSFDNLGAEAYIAESKYNSLSEKYLSPMDRPLNTAIPVYGVTPGEHIQAPARDVFGTRDRNQPGPTLNQILAGSLVTGLAGFAGFNCLFNTKIKLPSENKNIFVKCKERITSFFDSIKAKQAESKAKEAAKGFFSKHATAFKVTGGILAAIVGLYVLYENIIKPKQNNASASE